jgi:hypothetical protein
MQNMFAFTISIKVEKNYTGNSLIYTRGGYIIYEKDGGSKWQRKK